MATNLTQSQSGSGSAAVHAALAKEAAARRADAGSTSESAHRQTGYGLPCSKCHLYYPADLDVCPICKTKERVSPIVPKTPPKRLTTEAESLPDSAALEKEREEFLRQFKAQLLEAHASAMDDSEAVCKFGGQHPGDPGKPEVCTTCYDRLQERVDIMEGALHIDLKDAAQIVYDAVWSDPTDPSKTYQNAASALLSELRKRAGITSVLGPFQPLTH